jgi:hypothetical protein
MMRSLVQFDGETEVHARTSTATLCGRPIAGDTPCLSWVGDEQLEVSCTVCTESL